MGRPGTMPVKRSPASSLTWARCLLTGLRKVCQREEQSGLRFPWPFRKTPRPRVLSPSPPPTHCPGDQIHSLCRKSLAVVLMLGQGGEQKMLSGTRQLGFSKAFSLRSFLRQHNTERAGVWQCSALSQAGCSEHSVYQGSLGAPHLQRPLGPEAHVL